jgi:hypothetical protein
VVVGDRLGGRMIVRGGPDQAPYNREGRSGKVRGRSHKDERTTRFNPNANPFGTPDFGDIRRIVKSNDDVREAFGDESLVAALWVIACSGIARRLNVKRSVDGRITDDIRYLAGSILDDVWAGVGQTDTKLRSGKIRLGTFGRHPEGVELVRLVNGRVRTAIHNEFAKRSVRTHTETCRRLANIDRTRVSRVSVGRPVSSDELLPNGRRWDDLTGTEQGWLMLRAKGLENVRIAESLGISLRTVERMAQTLSPE